MLVPLESTSAVLVIMRTRLCLSAAVLLLDWTTVAETASLEEGIQIRCIRTKDSLNLGGQTLHRVTVEIYV